MKDALYQKHIDREAASGDGVHPNGCFWCGGDHSSTLCAEDVDELDGFDLADEMDDLADELDELEYEEDKDYE